MVPTSHRELAKEAFPERNGCGFSFGNGCAGGETEFNLFGAKKQNVTMVEKIGGVKQVDPAQLD